jgi:hypothetical protein
VVALNPSQFHEMSRSEFEAHPATYFHGNPTGNFNWGEDRPQGFHVGSHKAATEAVVARVGKVSRTTTLSDGTKTGPTYPGDYVPVNDPERPYTTSDAVAHPQHLRGGRIVSDMVNGSTYMGSYGKGDVGDMHASGDAMANGRVSAIKSRGETMRQGIFYRNMAEDAGSVSAVLPRREDFKTHEDYLVEARAKGKKIPPKALEGYTEVPGQQRLF